MSKAASMIRKSDFAGVEKVLGAYGGMGSFQDNYWKNLRIEELQHEMWELADSIKREVESEK